MSSITVHILLSNYL